ncbi:MAG TPA: RyR domain-containing protein [Caulobacteraceae bacterium]|nr:RyR domain-containing protein [Caulobacteraceae bacterium]
MERSGGLFPFRLAWLIPAMAALTILLGVWGWSTHHLPFDESLYRSIALFDIDGNAYSNGEPLADWRFRIGRWTGAAVVFSSLLALAALLHEHLVTALARWTKQSVVVVGSDPLALAGFEAACRQRRGALWLGAPAFGASAFTDIALAWPPRDRARSVFDHARGADHVLVAHDHDAEALSLARAARAAAPTAYVTVLMRDVRLAEDAAVTLNDPHTRVLSAAAVAARALAVAHPPFLVAKDRGHARIHALIVGFGQTGLAIARDLIVNCRTTYLDRPRITVIDPQAKALEGVLRVRAPELDHCADAAFIDGEISGRAVRPGPKAIAADLAAGGPITVAYVCLSDDEAALSAAATLQSLLRAVDIDQPPVFVRLREASVVAADGSGHGLDALTPFGDLDSVLAASAFLSNAPDATARAFSEAYRASLPAAQRDDPENRSAFPWDRLDETYRQINRDGVAHIAAKLASVGIDPARWRGVAAIPKLAPGERLFHGQTDLERLAILEHERWNAQRRMDGWRWADAPAKDETRKLHPYLKGYDALTEQVKEYDRVVVRATQDAVASDPDRAADGPPPV